MAAKLVPFDFGRGAARIARLREFFDNTAELSSATLQLPQNMVNNEVIAIGKDAYEVKLAAQGQAVGNLTVDDGAKTTVTLSAVAGLVAGMFIWCETEIMLVTHVGTAGGNNTVVIRGRSGTTAAAHNAAAATRPSDTLVPAAINIVSSTNASPIVVTANAHICATGEEVVIAGHETNTAANGRWRVVRTGANTVQLVRVGATAIVNSTGNGVGGATGTLTRVSARKVLAVLDGTPTNVIAALVAELNAGDRDPNPLGFGLWHAVAVAATGPVVIASRKRGAHISQVGILSAQATNIWVATAGLAAATVTAGGLAASARRVYAITRALTAADVTAQVVIIPLDFDPRSAIYTVRTAAGVVKVDTDLLTLVAAANGAPAYLKYAFAGATHFANTDVLTVFVTD